MITIHKYALRVKDWNVVEMPEGAQILDIQVQDPDRQDGISLWAIVDTFRKKEHRYIAVVGTGNPMPTKLNDSVQFTPGCLKHLRTLQHGVFVWHFFELPREYVVGGK